MKNIPVIANFIFALFLATGIGVTACFVASPIAPLHWLSAVANQRLETPSAHCLGNDAVFPRLKAHHPSVTAATASTAPLTIAKTNHTLPNVLHGLPLTFVENRGQVYARAVFHLQGRNTAAYFTGQWLTLTFTQPSAQHANNTSSATPSSRQSSVNRWNL